jgi:hypothetical protein
MVHQAFKVFRRGAVWEVGQSIGTVILQGIVNTLGDTIQGLVPSGTTPMAFTPFSHPNQRILQTVWVIQQSRPGKTSSAQPAPTHGMIRITLDTVKKLATHFPQDATAPETHLT